MADTTKMPEPVLISMSILAGLQTFFAGSTATTVMVEADPLLTAIFAFGALAVGAAQFGIQFYVRGRVAPVESIVERVNGDGMVVAGPANEIVPEGEVVRPAGADPVSVAVIDPAMPEGDHDARFTGRHREGVV